MWPTPRMRSEKSEYCSRSITAGAYKNYPPKKKVISNKPLFLSLSLRRHPQRWCNYNSLSLIHKHNRKEKEISKKDGFLQLGSSLAESVLCFPYSSGAFLSISLFNFLSTLCSFLKLCVNFYVLRSFFPWEKLGVFYPFKPKVANVLFLGKDENCKRAVISSLSDDKVTHPLYIYIYFFLWLMGWSASLFKRKRNSVIFVFLFFGWEKVRKFFVLFFNWKWNFGSIMKNWIVVRKIIYIKGKSQIKYFMHLFIFICRGYSFSIMFFFSYNIVKLNATRPVGNLEGFRIYSVFKEKKGRWAEKRRWERKERA